jgi:glutamine synthetase
MSHELRAQAIAQITERVPQESKLPKRLEELWATDVFSLNQFTEGRI